MFLCGVAVSRNRLISLWHCRCGAGLGWGEFLYCSANNRGMEKHQYLESQFVSLNGEETSRIIMRSPTVQAGREENIDGSYSCVYMLEILLHIRASKQTYHTLLSCKECHWLPAEEIPPSALW